MVYIGSSTYIAADLTIPAGITIPPKTKITCQADVAFYAAYLRQATARHRAEIRQSSIVQT